MARSGYTRTAVPGGECLEVVSIISCDFNNFICRLSFSNLPNVILPDIALKEYSISEGMCGGTHL